MATATSSPPPQQLRPWGEFLSLSAVSLPQSLPDLTSRISSNLRYFNLNYINVALVILFLSLLFHPLTIVVFLFLIAAWFYLHINRTIDDPLVILGRTIDDRVVLAVLGLVTLLALILVNVWWNVFGSAAVSAVVILLHAAVRAPEDGLDSPYGSLLSGTDSPRGGYTQDAGGNGRG